MSSINDERDDVDGDIRCIKFSGDHEKFDQWKEKTKDIARHKGILKNMTKEVEIPTEDEAYNDEDKMKIHEGNSKEWDFLIISLIEIPSGLVRQCDDNSDVFWKAFISNYEVSHEKQQSLNVVTKQVEQLQYKDTSQDPDIVFNGLYNLNLKFKKIKAKYKNMNTNLSHMFLCLT